jgi:hypothetical protein
MYVSIKFDIWVWNFIPRYICNFFPNIMWAKVGLKNVSSIAIFKEVDIELFNPTIVSNYAPGTNPMT